MRYRSLLYIDADARMDTYTDNDGNKRSNLSLIASKSASSQSLRRRRVSSASLTSSGNFDVISRARQNESEAPAETNDEGLVQ